MRPTEASHLDACFPILTYRCRRSYFFFVENLSSEASAGAALGELLQSLELKIKYLPTFGASPFCPDLDAQIDFGIVGPSGTDTSRAGAVFPKITPAVNNFDTNIIENAVFFVAHSMRALTSW